MIDKPMFERRAKELYRYLQNQTAAKKWKSGKRAGQIKQPKIPLPFSELDLARKLWEQFGLQARPCKYCSCPIDILSCTLDHRIPRRLGGVRAYELANLDAICTRCNHLKADLMPEEFLELRRWLNGVSSHLRTNIEGRLLQGGRTFSLNRAARKLVEGGAVAPAIKTSRPLPAYREPQGGLNLLPPDF